MVDAAEAPPAHTPPLPDPDAFFRPGHCPEDGLRLAPYAPFTNGMFMGWPPDQPVEATLRQTPARRPGRMRSHLSISGAEQAQWLTLEIELDHDRVAERRYAGIAADLAAAPLTGFGTTFRLHRSQGGFDDIALPRRVLDAEMQRLFLIAQVPEGMPVDMDAARPKLILWFDRSLRSLDIGRFYVL